MRSILLLFLACFLAPCVRGQAQVTAGGFVIGGGAATSGRLGLVSSVGQAVSTQTMQDGRFSLDGGFLSTVPTIPALSISHLVPVVVPLGEPVLLEAEIDAGVQKVEVYYRQGGAAEFDVVTMEPVEGMYRATIASDDVTTRGLAYYIAVLDSLDRTVYSPFVGAHGVRVHLPAPGVIRDQAQPQGSSQSAYRLISFPVQPTDNSPLAVLGSEFGAYDPDVWRFFELAFSQNYVEFQNIQSIATGKAYWLITTEAGRVLRTGTGVTTSLDGSFQIPLHPRWNLIGMPYDFPISTPQLSLKSGQPIALRALEDGWNDPVRNPVTTLRPFDGYAIFNALQTVDTLIVQPFPNGSGKRTGTVLASKTHAAADWSIHITGHTNYGRDGDNVVGVHEEALEDWDPLDLPEPPMIDPHVSVSFSRPEWEAASRRFSTDMRAPAASGHGWEFEVVAAEDGRVTLSFDGVESVPRQYDVRLIDEFAGVTQDLRTRARYEIVTAADAAYKLRLVAGTSELLSEAMEGIDLPSSVQVSDVYPNPFSSAVAVRFSLPEAKQVDVRIYDALGAEVATLLGGDVRSAGSHLLVWDGRTATGTRVSSGLYFVSLTAGDDRLTRKVVLVR